MSLLLCLNKPWAVTPSPSNTGTSQLLSTVWGQKKPSKSASNSDRTQWKVLWTAVVAKGQEGKVRMQPFFEWGGMKRTPADAHIIFWASCIKYSPSSPKLPEEAESGLLFIYYPVLNISFKLYSSALFLAASCPCCPWGGSLLYLRNLLTKHIQKSCSSGYTPVLITPPFSPPSSLPLPSSDVSYTEFCWPETVSTSRQRPCLFCVFVRCCSSPWSSVLHCSSTSLAMQSFTPSLTQKSYFKNAFKLLWVLNLQ